MYIMAWFIFYKILIASSWYRKYQCYFVKKKLKRKGRESLPIFIDVKQLHIRNWRRRGMINQEEARGRREREEKKDIFCQLGIVAIAGIQLNFFFSFQRSFLLPQFHVIRRFNLSIYHIHQYPYEFKGIYKAHILINA